MKIERDIAGNKGICIRIKDSWYKSRVETKDRVSIPPRPVI